MFDSQNSSSSFEVQQIKTSMTLHTFSLQSTKSKHNTWLWSSFTTAVVTAIFLFLSSIRWWSKGIPNASVFPLPVSAAPRTSRLSRMAVGSTCAEHSHTSASLTKLPRNFFTTRSSLANSLRMQKMLPDVSLSGKKIPHRLCRFFPRLTIGAAPWLLVARWKIRNSLCR